ncbi:MAG: DUF4143 domain-containing protein [Thermoanaerobaculia bacterium]
MAESPLPPVVQLGKDSLKGQTTTIAAGVLSLTEIATLRGIDLGCPFLADNGVELLAQQEFWRELVSHGKRVAKPRDLAFRFFSERGSHPLAHQETDSAWRDLADQLNETVIRRVLQHDLHLGRKWDVLLLEQVFRLACRYIGETPGVELFARETRRALGAEVSPKKILTYLHFLGDTLLLRLIEPLEIPLKKSPGNAKICLSDHGLRASWLQEVVPIDPEALSRDPHLHLLAGRIAESVVGATLSTISNLDLSHLPARDDQLEIDFILTIGTKRIPLEVKYQRRLDPLRDTEALRTFLEKSVNNAPFGLLVSQTDNDEVFDPRIVTVPLSSLMLLR